MKVRIWRLLALLVVAALVAAACGSDDDDDGAAPGPDDGGSEQPADDDGGEEDDDFEVDRSGRFSQLDTFCEPAEGEPEEEPERIDAAMTEDTITISHARLKLEQLVDIGFGVDVGDQHEQFQTFIDLINDRCGGIHGRQLVLEESEVDAIPPPGTDGDSLAREACIEITEDQNALFAVSASGFGGSVAVQCLTSQNDVFMVAASQATDEDFEAADGKLVTTLMTPEASLRSLARYAHSEGLLEGKTIGIVSQDRPGEAAVMDRGLISVLEDELGYEVKRFDIIGCGGSSICKEGLPQSVTNMVADGVDVLFPGLNIINLPSYIAEMVTQGVEPGQITFLSSNYHSQAGDLVSGKIVEFGGEAAGELYDGTLVTDAVPTGSYRLPDYEVAEFDAMCNREFAENSASGTAYERNDEQDSLFGSVVTACVTMRIIARALEDAGVNPSRDDIAEAIKDLGGVDVQYGVPGHITEGKYFTTSVIFPMRYHYPCPHPTTSKAGSCIVPEGDPLPLPERE